MEENKMASITNMNAFVHRVCVCVCVSEHVWRELPTCGADLDRPPLPLRNGTLRTQSHKYTELSVPTAPKSNDTLSSGSDKEVGGVEKGRVQRGRREHHSTARHGNERHSTAHHSTAMQSKAEHVTAQHGTAQRLLRVVRVAPLHAWAAAQQALARPIAVQMV